MKASMKWSKLEDHFKANPDHRLGWSYADLLKDRTRRDVQRKKEMQIWFGEHRKQEELRNAERVKGEESDGVGEGDVARTDGEEAGEDSSR